MVGEPEAATTTELVLVVDDDELTRTVIVEILTEEGVRTLAASNVAEARIALDDFAVDAIVSDLRMPGCSGIDFLRELRAAGHATPFLMITGFGETAEIIDALNLGACSLIQKPFRPAEVCRAVGEALSRLRLERENERLRRDLQAANVRLRQDMVDEVIRNEELFLATLTSLANAIDARDSYTHTHSANVSGYAKRLATTLALDETATEAAVIGGQVHDIGKIAIPETILQKPAKLTAEEFAVIREHPTRGAKILAPIPNFELVLPAVRHHHERFDGGGYPDGLAGEDIPLLARILTICDAWDAMTTDRPYRKGMSGEQAETILIAGKGTQFDPALVTAFLDHSRP